MARTKAPSITFLVETKPDGDYTDFEFSISIGDEFESIDSIIAGTIDNADEYGSEESCKAVQEYALALKKEGYSRVCRYKGLGFKIVAQKPNNGGHYLEPCLEDLASRPSDVRAQLAIINRLGRAAAKHIGKEILDDNFTLLSNPDDLRAVLVLACKATEVSRPCVISGRFNWYVPKTNE